MPRVLLLNANRRGIGTYHRAYHFGRQLSLRGFGCTLVTVSNRHPIRRIQWNDESGLEVVEGPNFLDRLPPWHASGPLDIAGRLVDLFSARWDVVYAFEYHPNVSVPALLGRWFRGVRLISDWCDWHAGAGNEFGGKRWAHWVDARFEEFIRHRADRVTVINDVLRRRAISIGISPQRVHVVTEGVDCAYVRPLNRDEARGYLGLPATPKFVVTIRDSWAGYRLLVDALPLLRDRWGDCRLVSLGRVWPEGRAHAEKVGVSESVIDTGWIADEDLPQWLAAADVLALPLEDDLRNRGRWPHKLGDMVAAQRPVVVSRAGEFPERLIRAEAVTEAAWSAEGFANAICRVLGDSSIARKTAENGREFALNALDWSRIGEDLAAIVKLTIK